MRTEGDELSHGEDLDEKTQELLIIDGGGDLMPFLFSYEFFGIVMTLVGCLIYTSGDFAVFRTILAVLLTIGGIMLTLKTSRKWLLTVHVLMWGLALAFPLLPKPIHNWLSVLYTAALIPFVLNIIRIVIRRLVGIEEKK